VYFGHNPLQQLTYTLMYLVFLSQALTGLALWGLYDHRARFWALFQWMNDLLGPQQIRLTHLLVMWLILVFLPMHVYLSVRADSVERSGAISSMVSGGRWIRRGAVFEDWPPRAPEDARRGRAGRRGRQGRPG
jgi:Ni/Fe-hydrogenase b-type cytochrome subunit